MKTNTMEEDIVYVGKLNMPYTDPTNFKEKEAHHIISIINGGNIRDNVKFRGYGNMFFDEEDNRHWNPNFIQLENYTRNKSNILIFDLLNCEYDKMFVYKTNGKIDGFYGIVVYNTLNQKSVNIFNIEYNYAKLMEAIIRMILHKKINN